MHLSGTASGFLNRPHFRCLRSLNRGSRCKAPQDFQSVGRSIRRKEVGDGSFIAPWSTEKHHRPLHDPFNCDMNILPGLRLVDEFALQNQCEWLFGSFNRSRKLQRLGIAGKRIVVVVAIALIRRPILRMAPHPVFKNFIPNEAAPCRHAGGIASNLFSVECIRIHECPNNRGKPFVRIQNSLTNGLRNPRHFLRGPLPIGPGPVSNPARSRGTDVPLSGCVLKYLSPTS
jgi:hypothetical protein